MTLALVTGSSGLVGSETAFFLIDRGFEVIGVDNNERKNLFGIDGDTARITKKLIKHSRSYKHFSFDITKKMIWKKYLKKIKIKSLLYYTRLPNHLMTGLNRI